MSVDTDLDWLFKNVYTDKAIADMAMRDHPLYARIRKEGGFTGRQFNYPWQVGSVQGIGSTVAYAQANISDLKGYQPYANRRISYGVIRLNGEDLLASAGDRGAFADVFQPTSDSVIYEYGDDQAFGLYRDGTGMRARVVSEASEVLTLTVADDARNFKINMVLQADNAADGSSPNAGTTFVTAFDPDAGTVTVEDASDAVIVANDYLFRNGSNGTGASPSYLEGLALCTPLTAPTGSDSFRGLPTGSRAAAPALMAGSRLDDTSSPIEYNIGRVAVKVAQNGGRVTEAYINPINFFAVATRLNAKVEYQSGGGTADYGFQYLMVHTATGTIKVFSDPDCPTNRGYLMNPESHYIKTLNEFPHRVTDGGNKSMWGATSDYTEWRIRGMANYIQTEPRNFGVFSI
jgi:hypothetical protein